MLIRYLTSFSRLADNPETKLDQKKMPFTEFEIAVKKFLEHLPFDKQAFGINTTRREVGDLAREIVVRCHARVAIQAEFPDRGIDVAKKLFDFITESGKKNSLATADVLFWASHSGLARLCNSVPESLQKTFEDESLTLYAVASCEQANGNDVLAAENGRACICFIERQTDQQMLAAIRLDHWGLVDWADREYQRVIASPNYRPNKSFPCRSNWPNYSTTLIDAKKPPPFFNKC